MLLIIFMVATPLIQQEQNDPGESADRVGSAQQPQEPDKERFESITVQADGRCCWADGHFRFSSSRRSSRSSRRSPKPPVIRICGAMRTRKVQQLVTVMDELKKHDLTKVAFDTQVAR